MKEEMTITQFYLYTSQKNWLREYAKRHDISLAAAGRQAVDAFINSVDNATKQ